MDTNERNRFNVAFGNFIKDARLKKKIMQGDAARHVGLTQSYYSYIEAGARNVDLQIAFKICDYLNLNLNDFFAKNK